MQKERNKEPWNKLSFIQYLRYRTIDAEQTRVIKRQRPKPIKPCLLPSCTKQIRHNGGYCCAECCKKHRLLLKEKK